MRLPREIFNHKSTNRAEVGGADSKVEGARGEKIRPEFLLCRVGLKDKSDREWGERLR